MSFIIFLKLIIVFIILYFVLQLFISNEFYKYFNSSFPNNEAKFYKSLHKTYGISQCKYQGMTPILTCSYDSRI